jgi:hypothetical protein
MEAMSSSLEMSTSLASEAVRPAATRPRRYEKHKTNSPVRKFTMPVWAPIGRGTGGEHGRSSNSESVGQLVSVQARSLVDQVQPAILCSESEDLHVGRRDWEKRP